MRFQVSTGSEHHTTETRSAVVKIDGKPIWEVLRPDSTYWETVGNKGRHGKWCVAEYDIPLGTEVEFVATANGRPDIEISFVVTEGQVVDYEGYKYNDTPRGWIVSF